MVLGANHINSRSCEAEVIKGAPWRKAGTGFWGNNEGSYVISQELPPGLCLLVSRCLLPIWFEPLLPTMKISILFGLSVLVQQGTCLVPRACAAYVTARSGDTCASIAASVGITVTEFLRNNPSVSKCDSLAAGTRYCIDSSSTPPLQISTDGQCGGNLTCAGSSYGDCCSEHGW